MTKILFICHGNICRSPMAEFLMKELVEEKGLINKFYITSASTSNEEIGNPVYPPIRKILNEKGIDTSGKRAIRVTKEDYENYDYLICMDRNNLKNLRYIIGEDLDNKVSLLMDYTNTKIDVADPWYTRDFKQTQSDIEKGCKGLLEYILNNL